MIIRKSDLTNEAIDMGVWDALCEAAGIEPERDEYLSDHQEINIDRIEGEE
jgi:hypothetical protein